MQALGSERDSYAANVNLIHVYSWTQESEDWWQNAQAALGMVVA